MAVGEHAIGVAEERTKGGLGMSVGAEMMNHGGAVGHAFQVGLNPVALGLHGAGDAVPGEADARVPVFDAQARRLISGMIPGRFALKALVGNLCAKPKEWPIVGAPRILGGSKSYPGFVASGWADNFIAAHFQSVERQSRNRIPVVAAQHF